MKKVLLLLICVLFVSGCGFMKYKIDGHQVSFDEAVDFRHIHYQTSTSFDYNSDHNYRSYSLYDKIPNVIYSVKVSKVAGSMKQDLEKKKAEKGAKTKKKKIHGILWTVLTYKEDKNEYHLYYASYDKKEYYQIEFFAADFGKEFEEKFMKLITIQ